MTDFLLDDLNPQQRRAVTAPDGQVLVLAGPGSGKTRVLTRRLAWLIERQNVPAFDIIAVTFTNKAAREMESRVVTLAQRSLEGMWLGTFHAMCARILRRESVALPFAANFVIFDSDDQQTLVKRALRDLHIDDKTHRPAGIHASISAAKNDLKLPSDMPRGSYRDEVVAKTYARYQEYLQLNNAVDFDDLLLWARACSRKTLPSQKNTPAASSTCWWTSSRIPTWRSMNCSGTWPPFTRTSSWWAMKISPLSLARRGLPQRAAL
jgi:DNA helicase-2/ATP-dependent DNA helicase PcrA